MSGREQIIILCDGMPRALPTDTTLADFVGQLGHAPNAVTTAINGQFVARTERAQCLLQAADAVLLFQPIVGG